jgi:hypothetical protein
MQAYIPNIGPIVRARLNSYVSPEIRSSPVRGRGLFAMGEFRPGEVVYVMGGYAFTRQSSEVADPGSLSQRSEIQIADNLFIGAIHPDDSMIASNHSCDPNTALQGQIIFVALREIAAGEMRPIPSSATAAEPHAGESLRARTWQQKDLQRRYRGLFSSNRRSSSANSESSMAIAEGVLGNDCFGARKEQP